MSLANIVILLYKPLSVSKKQVDIWEKRVHVLGGKIIQTPTLKGITDQLIIVADNSVDENTLRTWWCTHTGLKTLPKASNRDGTSAVWSQTNDYVAEYHSIQWLIDCLATEKRVGASVHIWEPSYSNKHVKTENVLHATPAIQNNNTHAMDTTHASASDTPLGANSGVTSAETSEVTVIPTTVGDMSDENIAALYACGDDASRIGTSPGVRPIICPFTYSQVMSVNFGELRSSPWLQLLLAPSPAPTSTVSVPQQPMAVRTNANTINHSCSTGMKRKRPESLRQSHRKTRHTECDDNATTDFSSSQSTQLYTNLNQHITSKLSKLLDIYAATIGKTNVRYKQLVLAIGAIARLPVTINTVEELHALGKIESVGPHTQAKLVEILTTGNLHRVRQYENDESVHTILDLMTIPWVGRATAQKLITAGARTVADVRASPTMTGMLSTSSRICLQYYDELQQPITRSESKRVQAYLNSVIESIAPNSRVFVGGSFRRGSLTSSDLDVIIYIHPPATTQNSFDRFLSLLQENGFLMQKRLGAYWRSQRRKNIDLHDDGVDADDDSMQGDETEESDTQNGGNVAETLGAGWQRRSFFGLCISPPAAVEGEIQLHRRIDFLCFEPYQWPYGLLSWTGNIVLNRSLRNYARHLGLTLNDSTLYVSQSKTSTVATEIGLMPGESIHLHSEFDIFSFFGLRFIPPNQRNVATT